MGRRQRVGLEGLGPGRLIGHQGVIGADGGGALDGLTSTHRRPDLAFRRVTRDDFELIARWLAAPHVARWWHHEFTVEAVARDFGPCADGDEPAEDFIASLDGRPIGLIQRARFVDYPEDLDELALIVDVPQGAIEIDYLIGDPADTGRGLGTAMIGAFVELAWQTMTNVPCIIVPVASANPASWKALIKAGFRLEGRGLLEPDNPIDDGMHEILRLDRPPTSS